MKKIIISGVPKLKLESLRHQLPRFSVITMPQRSSRKSSGLTEICEEFEGEEEEDNNQEEDNLMADSQEDLASCAGSESSVEKQRLKMNSEGKTVVLNISDDPIKRFQVKNNFFCFNKQNY